MLRKLHHCIVAECSVLTRFIHPFATIREKHTNKDKEQKSKHKTTVCLIGAERIKVDNKMQDVYIFRSDYYPNATMYAVKRWLKVLKEGPEDTLFEPPAPQVTEETKANEPEELPNLPRAGPDGFLQEEIAAMEATGISVEDDNAPAPENVPTTIQNNDITYGEWGHKNICYRRAKGSENTLPSINPQYVSWEQQQHINCSAWFLLLFLIDWLAENIFIK